MAYILDTHTFLWFINGDNQLSAKAKKSITDPNALKYISIASLWEIAIKVNIGKLTLDMRFEELKQEIVSNGFEMLQISFEHTLKVSTLNLYHRDPFDRIIIAQAITEDSIVLTSDKHFSSYPVKCSW